MSKIKGKTYESNTHEWFMPLGFVDKVLKAAQIDQFDLDVCSSIPHIPANKYYTPQDNGLEHPWEGYCWMNPPYGRDLFYWVSQASLRQDFYDALFALLPARVETQYYHNFVLRDAACICFLQSPFSFLKNENGILKPSGKAGFPLMLAVYSRNKYFVTDFVDGFEKNEDVTVMRKFEI